MLFPVVPTKGFLWRFLIALSIVAVGGGVSIALFGICLGGDVFIYVNTKSGEEKLAHMNPETEQWVALLCIAPFFLSWFAAFGFLTTITCPHCGRLYGVVQNKHRCPACSKGWRSKA